MVTRGWALQLMTPNAGRLGRCSASAIALRIAAGRGAVIAPWNFPLAIPIGMTTAALVTGNTVSSSPPSRRRAAGCGSSRRCARAASRPARSRCCPARVRPARRCIQPGRRDDRVHRLGAVGQPPGAAAQVRPGARQLTRVVAENGKNCIVVDSDADLDEAIPAIVDSAFTYAGQKCSAGGRVLVHEARHDALVERLAGAVAGLQVGPADEFATDVPPLIERAAQERVERYAAIASETGELVGPSRRVPAEGRTNRRPLLRGCP